METRKLQCPSCSAPLQVLLGEVETGCEYCGSRLKMLPGEAEMEVVRTREEMKRKERVEVQRLILEQKLKQEEAERWRALAGKVAIAALPVVGNAAARAMVHAALHRRGCGCSVLLALFASATATLAVVLLAIRPS